MADRSRRQGNPYRRLQRAVFLAAVAACLGALFLLAAPMLLQRQEAARRSMDEADSVMVLAAARVVESRSALLQYLQGASPVDAAFGPIERALEDVDRARTGASEERNAQLAMLREALLGYEDQVEAVRTADLTGEADEATGLALQTAESGAALTQWAEQVIEDNLAQAGEYRAGSAAWAYRGALLLGVFSVALMLGALVWVVRVASQLSTLRSRGISQSQPSRGERTSETVVREVQVAERRLSLMRRAVDVSRATTGILDPDVLATRAVEAIRQGFEPACTGIFLVEAAGAISMRAGTCENSNVSVPEGDRLGPGEGRLRECVSSAQLQLLSGPAETLLLRADIGLPDHRTEALVPLRNQGQALGILVVQEQSAGALDDDTVSALQGIADQLGSAFAAASTFAEVQTALQATRAACAQADREALIRDLPEAVSGYRGLASGDVEPIVGGWDEDLAHVVADGDVLRQDRTLVLPIRIRDAAVGAVRLQKPEAGPEWSEREIDLAGVIVDHLGHALESARLHAEIRSIYAREQLAREVSQQLGASTDWDTLMQTAVQEIGRAVQASRVFVQWVPPTTGAAGSEPVAAGEDEVADQ